MDGHYLECASAAYAVLIERAERKHGKHSKEVKELKRELAAISDECFRHIIAERKA
jgi:hypothetical protein